MSNPNPSSTNAKTTVSLPKRGNPCIEIAHKFCYLLHFRRGFRPPETIAFLFNGNPEEAVLRGREHCKTMGFKFCGCYPFIVDLDTVEQLRLEEHPELSSATY